MDLAQPPHISNGGMVNNKRKPPTKALKTNKHMTNRGIQTNVYIQTNGYILGTENPL
jgi:hypothetical protein